VRGECVPFRRYARREGAVRSFRTVSPQPLSSSRSSGRAYNLLGRSPAALTASFHVGKYRKTKYFGIPARATNSDIDGARPSCFATAAMDSEICCWLGMGVKGGLKNTWCRCRGDPSCDRQASGGRGCLKTAATKRQENQTDAASDCAKSRPDGRDDSLGVRCAWPGEHDGVVRLHIRGS
jgi:hypothetical protein